MVLTGNKAKRLSSVNQTIKIIHHHYYDRTYTLQNRWREVFRPPYFGCFLVLVKVFNFKNETLSVSLYTVFTGVFTGDVLNLQRCHPDNIYLFKFNQRNTRKRCELCSKLTIKTPDRHQWRRSGVFIANFEHIPHLFLVFLLALNK